MAIDDASAAPRRVRRRRLLRRLVWIWIAFWLLMFLLGTQEHFWSGGRRLVPPLVDYGSAALLATLLAAWKIHRADRLDRDLERPAVWLLRWSAWLPFEWPAYLGLLAALRALFYPLFGERWHHGPWREIVVYESGKFLLYYALFAGIHFGLKSYGAWLQERLRVEHQTRLAREAQLAQLTQQLEPHFLFNALNTIASLIHTDPDAADALLTRLAALLRAASDASRRPEQPLGEELALLRGYAELMTARFGERVSIDWQLDPTLDACRVPTLGLQPLLENCFRHVVEPRRAPTRIVVRSRPIGAARLRLEIENDGATPVFPLAEGVGLANLRQRLISLHDDAARLGFEPRDGGGLIVQVELPCAC